MNYSYVITETRTNPNTIWFKDWVLSGLDSIYSAQEYAVNSYLESVGISYKQTELGNTFLQHAYTHADQNFLISQIIKTQTMWPDFYAARIKYDSDNKISYSTTIVQRP